MAFLQVRKAGVTADSPECSGFQDKKSDGAETVLHVPLTCETAMSLLGIAAG